MSLGLPPELRRLKEEVRGYAVEYNLDFFEVIFEVLDWKQINEVAAYSGFPNRYPHWRFGMQYERLSKSYAYGLSKIYEMVINNDPCYAYLLHSNNLVDQKMVMAHVYGHSDFFKNNQYFAHTNRKMMDEMANHRTRVLRYVDRYGFDKVEDFIDACLSLETLIDYHAPAIRRTAQAGEERVPEIRKLGMQARPYMERYINPPEYIEAEKQRIEAEQQQPSTFPETPRRDIVNFLIEHAPLDAWENDILSIISEEAQYFAPQGQTKIINEGWACVTGDTRIVTDHGSIPAWEIVEKKLPLRMFDGTQWQRVIDWAHFPRRKTVRILTRRGLVVEGSSTHRVLTAQAPEQWKRLDELEVSDKIVVSASAGAWPESYAKIEWVPRRRATLEDVAHDVGVNLSTVIRYRAGTHQSRSAEQLAPAVAAYEKQLVSMPYMGNSRHPIQIPKEMDEQLAQFLGYLIGDGHISRIKRVMGLTSGDDEPKEAFARLGTEMFGLKPKIRRDGNRWRVLLHSEDLADFLISLGLTHGPSARKKSIPELIWRSPRSVVSAFLRAYFDSDGYAGKSGVILSTFSDSLAIGTQQLLLQFGILSRRRRNGGGWHVHIMGHSAARYAAEIGFGIIRKKERLRQYLESHKQWHKESFEDEIVEIDVGEQDVYDFTVENTHRYVAHGFVNHNSYWHSRIMTERALKDHEVIDYADHHSGTMAMQGRQLNPYKIGIELLRDIEERWNKGQFGKEYEECQDMRERASWDRKLGLGREKIFEVRRIYNDLNFIDEFLTPEFCQRHKLFVYAYNISSDQFEIAGRTFEKIKRQLLFELTNCGYPILAVSDANYQNRGELVLKHSHEGVDLRLDFARETLASVFHVWRRPIHVDTIVEGVPKLLSFDGENYKEARP